MWYNYSKIYQKTADEPALILLHSCDFSLKKGKNYRLTGYFFPFGARLGYKG